jgi:hypothetical protein
MYCNNVETIKIFLFNFVEQKERLGIYLFSLTTGGVYLNFLAVSGVNPGGGQTT